MTTDSVTKAIEITSQFEGGAGFQNLAGNFDGAGISFGFIQFNAKSGTLQTLLNNCVAQMPETTEKSFGSPNYHRLVDALKNRDFLGFCIGLNGPGNKVKSDWAEGFRKLGATDGCRKLQIKQASGYVNRAKQLMGVFGFKSERAYCLLFDTCIQNGAGIIDQDADRARINFRKRNQDFFSERARLFILAEEIANTSKNWRNDVLSRKMCIASGAGKVHGKWYDLATSQISDGPADYV